MYRIIGIIALALVGTLAGCPNPQQQFFKTFDGEYRITLQSGPPLAGC